MKTVQIDPYFFSFETDFVHTLKCVPMIVRYKLDSCGVKLQLRDWAGLGLQHKEELANKACYTSPEIEEYGAFVKAIVWQNFNYYPGMLCHVDDCWNNLQQVPVQVQQKAQDWNCQQLTLQQWIKLNTLQRFALVKLSRSEHEGKNFPLAMSEFNL